MSSDFQMTPLCRGCGGAEDLYGNNSMCLACGITGLIMELDISKDDICSSSRTNVAANDTPSPSLGLLKGPFTEDEIRAVLLSCTNLTCVDLVTMFKPRLRSREDREAFKAVLKKIAQIRKANGVNYVVLREDTRCISKYNVAANDTPSPFPRPLTAPSTNVTTVDLVSVFTSRLRIREEKSLKDESGFNSKSNVAAAKDTPTQPSRSLSTAATTRPVTEDEIRAVLLENTSMTAQELVDRFKSRLRTREDKQSFTHVLKKICVINKNKHLVLRDGRKYAPPTTTRPVTEDEIRAVLLPNTCMTAHDLVGRFKSRLRTPCEKQSFTRVLRKISVINKNKHLVLRDGRK